MTKEQEAKAACPCCGCLTIEHRSCYQICPVCFWEDDGDWENPDDPVSLGGPNHMTLAEGRKNYAEFRACSRDMLVHCREPLPEEIPASRLEAKAEPLKMPQWVDLKPCPFCGSPARWPASTESEDWEIQCSRESCPVMFIGGDETGRELAAAWNRRAVAPTPAAPSAVRGETEPDVRMELFHKHGSGLSWSGFNLYGDRKSIDKAKNLLHNEGRSEALSQIIVQERTASTAEITRLESELADLKRRLGVE